MMMKKKMNAVAAMAMVLMILLSANMDTISVAAQGVNCYDDCNTGCAGLPPDEYVICDKKCIELCKCVDMCKCVEISKCIEMCRDEGKIDGNLVFSAKKY